MKEKKQNKKLYSKFEWFICIAFIILWIVVICLILFYKPNTPIENICHI